MERNEAGERGEVVKKAERWREKMVEERWIS